MNDTIIYQRFTCFISMKMFDIYVYINLVQQSVKTFEKYPYIYYICFYYLQKMAYETEFYRRQYFVLNNKTCDYSSCCHHQ